MNHRVPDFEIQMDEDEYPIPMSNSGLTGPKKSMVDDDIMELLWQNGQVVMQSQNQRPFGKPLPERNTDGEIPAGTSTAREIRPPPQADVAEYHNQHLFMQEDEMTSWLHYPIDDDPPPLDHNFSADLLYSPPAVNTNQSNNSAMQYPVRTSQLTELRPPERSVAPQPPIWPARRTEQFPTKIHNFAHFSKHNARAEPGPSSSSRTAARESTVVDSCDTPLVTASRVSESVRSSAERTEGDNGGGSMTERKSSPGGSSSSAEQAHRAAEEEDRRRKGGETEESECQSQDVDFESGEAKKQVRGSTSRKRSRATEVHNLSERRRRDKINEKMRALQELIPRCNKSDKASMLDEAIEYLKSLQLQVQMMSMGCGMVPIMFPGLQQYMSPMGMGMGMEMGMNRPAMPFPNMLAGSALLPATAAAHLGPRFPMPPFHMPHIPSPDSSKMQVANQSAHDMNNSLNSLDPNQLRIPNSTNPYHQYLSPHQVQFQLMQNQAMNQPNVSRQSTSRDHDNPENHQSEGT